MAILKEIQKEIKNLEDPKKAKTWKIFFKEGYKGRGISVPECKEIAKKHSKNLDYKEALKISDSLIKTNCFEEGIIGITLIYQFKNKFDISTFKIFEKWIKKNVSNWAHCDYLCGKPMHEILLKNPELISELKKWSKSKNKWVKRASIVSLVNHAKSGENLSDILEISLNLRNAKEETVKKGIGWVLKEYCKSQNKNELISFLIENNKNFSKSTLRYACESLEAQEKKQILN